LAFNSGGYFAGAPGQVAVVLGLILVIHITVADDPFAGFGPTLIVAATALGLLAVWTLVSAIWSKAPATAMIEFDRTLLYWLGLVLFGSIAGNRRQLIWAIRFLALAVFVVAIVALATRLAPDIWPAPSDVDRERLGFPLTYWNALGVFVTVGILLCAHLTMRREEPPWVKAIAALAIPIMASTLYFTFSRGSLAACFIGLVVYLLLARPREVLTGGLAILPATAVAVVFSYRPEVLSTGHFESAVGVSQGHHLIPIVIACALGAGAIRLALSFAVDRRLAQVRVAPETRRTVVLAGAGAFVVALIVISIAVDLPGRISHQVENFTHGNPISESGDLSSRFTDFSNNGRLEHWHVALDDFAAHPLNGSGAGTFGRVWAEFSHSTTHVEDAHSLYIQTLAELGIIGFLLLAVVLIAIVGGFGWRARGPDRAIFAVLFAAALAWMFDAAVDWVWQMPATGFWIFAFGGLALARPAGRRMLGIPGRLPRVALGVGLLALIVTPALIALSQAKLDNAVAALKEGNCTKASQEALDATHLVSARPEPYQVLGFCDSRLGEGPLAVKMLETAVSRYPRDWESFYGLALVKGANGEDPRPAAREAFRLAPEEPLTNEAKRIFNTSDPKKWERRARTARLPIY
jgi:O-antigen ligase